MARVKRRKQQRAAGNGGAAGQGPSKRRRRDVALLGGGAAQSPEGFRQSARGSARQSPGAASRASNDNQSTIDVQATPLAIRQHLAAGKSHRGGQIGFTGGLDAMLSMLGISSPQLARGGAGSGNPQTRIAPTLSSGN